MDDTVDEFWIDTVYAVVQRREVLGQRVITEINSVWLGREQAEARLDFLEAVNDRWERYGAIEELDIHGAAIFFDALDKQPST